ncbi:HAD hydrolase-like protein [Pseudarthrobacter sp. N5]|uniref:HAD hydrolase-like protein n=1 Tax=Pseudarthrobacter sp. N5 TaxID=3418416 RepID=UPI003CF40EE6
MADPLLHRLGWKVAGTRGTADDHGGGLLDAVVCSDEVGAGRPARHMVHRAMELTGVLDFREVRAAGDTVNDLLAATRAGVTAVGVLTGMLDRKTPGQHPHRHILDGVKDIPSLLIRLAAFVAGTPTARP